MTENQKRWGNHLTRLMEPASGKDIYIYMKDNLSPIRWEKGNYRDMTVLKIRNIKAEYTDNGRK